MLMRLQKMFRFSFQLGAFWRERFVSGDTQRARHSRKQQQQQHQKDETVAWRNSKVFVSKLFRFIFKKWSYVINQPEKKPFNWKNVIKWFKLILIDLVLKNERCNVSVRRTQVTKQRPAVTVISFIQLNYRNNLNNLRGESESQWRHSLESRNGIRKKCVNKS